MKPGKRCRWGEGVNRGAGKGQGTPRLTALTCRSNGVVVMIIVATILSDSTGDYFYQN